MFIKRVLFAALLSSALLFLILGCANSAESKFSEMPIGMFDSGTGGLTVMEAFLTMDSFNNVTGEEVSDGVLDFAGEDFIYLADQANMPYGVYSSVGKTDYLKELIIKDAKFLNAAPNNTKLIIVACNTATAYGLDDIKRYLAEDGKGISVIGVIESGAGAALNSILKDEPLFGVGVLATVGTIASGGYENTLRKMVAERSYTGEMRVVNQGGLGFAESVDMEIDYILPSADKVRANYRGPIYGDPDTGIIPELLPLYNFDASGLLIERDSRGNIVDMQLNSAGNYARFHMVSLVEKHRKSNPGVKLKSVIMGCTHYPYFTDTLKRVVEELRAYDLNGERVYAELFDENISYIDPGVDVARESFRKLYADKWLNDKKAAKENTLRGYISVPADGLNPEFLDENGNLTYEHKYGREVGEESSSVKVVPFSQENINSDNLKRIETRLPASYSLMQNSLKR